MISRSARLLVLVVTLLFPILAGAQEPWDQPAFASDAKALLAAAEKIDAGEHDAVILLDESVYTLESDGRSKSVGRLMYRITGESAVERLDQVTAGWSPWYHDRPIIAARVITRDGTVHPLDQSAITEAPARPDSSDIFSDGRVLRAPLPAVAVGSIVEYTITQTGNSPLADAGITDSFIFGAFYPVHRSRVVIDHPASMQPRVVNKSGIAPRIEDRDGRRLTFFEKGRIEAIEELEDNLPFDVAVLPHISFSTGKSWGDVARRYAEIVDSRIAGSELQKLVRNAVGRVTDRREIVSRILAAIQKEIRYAGVEVGEGSIIPRPPKTVLSNKYGDCKDKATLLVAMLREAGLEAHVALLRAGHDHDVEPELPGLGGFNHAIVVVPGEPAIWVDPTDIYARAGELPISDQGRLALIAAPGTTSLTRTPEAASTDNVTREVRTFYLPEDGKARVTEVNLPGAIDESNWRHHAATAEKKAYRDSMESYALSYYLGKKFDKLEVGDPRTLDKPFRVSFEVAESESGVVSDGEGSVAIHPAALVNWVPSTLTDWEEANPNETSAAKKKEQEKKRVNDFLFPTPGVREWEYRIVPPAGYVARTLPENETKKLGTTTLTKTFKTEADGTVVATLRFDSGKRRISAAEFEETRVELSKLVASEQFLVGFEQVGKARLNAGDVGGALAEFRRLAALHPKEAQHHMEMARALLAGGLGETAREEARLAVKIEPANAKAYDTLAYVLQHDLLGRPLRKGFDLAGAIAAERKARELKPDDIDIAWALVRMLTIGEDGLQYGRGARVEEALAEMRQLMKNFGPEAKALEPELLLMYAHLGRFQEMKDLAAKLESQQQRELGRVIAVAAMEGGAAAKRELGAFSQATRRSYAQGAAQTLIALRHYSAAAQLLELATQGTPNANDSQALLDMLRKAKRAEELAIANDARGVVQLVMRDIVAGKPAAELYKHFARRTVELDKDEESATKELLGKIETVIAADGLTLAVAGDISLSSVDFQVEGDEKSGWRVRPRLAGDTFADFFVIRENDRYAIGAVFGLQMGRVLLDMASTNPERAHVWLNWVREVVETAGGDDPYAGMPFPMYWPKAKAASTPEEVRIAAALLTLTGKAAKESEAVLLAAREKAESDHLRTIFDLALTVIYGDRKEWAKVLPIAERLAKAHPESPSAFLRYATVLSLTGRSAEAEKLAHERFAKTKEREAIVALSSAATTARDYAKAQKYAQQLIDELSPNRGDYNHAAWLALFTNSDFDRALEHARRATSGDGGPGMRASLHTLAALYAETGKTLEARTALLKSLEIEDRNGEPEAADWYVLGRIAENYGVRESALSAYKRVTKEDLEAGASTWELAEKRLKALAK